MGTLKMCEHQYYLEYILGRKSRPRWRTEVGSMVHKALELLARKKVALQDGVATFSDEELGKTYTTDEMTVEFAVDEGYRHYSEKNLSQTEWTEEHREDVRKNVLNVIEHAGGVFNPLNRDIISPELHFDFELEEPWAWYDYRDVFTGDRIQGYLRLKGTIDLVTRLDSDTLEYCDWKSGRMYDWAQGVDKDWTLLRKDPQLLLYFYALTRLFPQFKHIIVTIFYSRERAPWTIPFDRDRDTKLALGIIREAFETIKNTAKPKRIWDNPKKRFSVCTSFCFYGTNTNEQGKTLCQAYHDDVVQLGMDRATKKNGVPGAYARYGAGGGVENRDG